ncbi:hypothetical protein EST38_g12124 [Candolleomyces aberdarensis]|uniref:DUF985 domain-containing protein n=1 Tax=Candolleomyces aberdarensis TaxID=2316362 RepID=A0A4Q2D4R0_9AGAR|nr:hypothetical protein EST38_g12124 [Candolleomyces aberdarensis]
MPATPTKQLVADLGLERHPEGGYFKQTDCQEETVPTPFADGDQRPLSTSIFYLLSHDNPAGVIHMNKSVTYHILHQGRAEYTLITPGSPPKIERHVMGSNAAAGEKMQLIVGTGIWKMSQLLAEDINAAESENDKELVNCLITEVVVPGFQWMDHKFLTRDGLDELFKDVDKEERAKAVSQYSRYLKQ